MNSKICFALPARRLVGLTLALSGLLLAGCERESARNETVTTEQGKVTNSPTTSPVSNPSATQVERVDEQKAREQAQALKLRADQELLAGQQRLAVAEQNLQQAYAQYNAIVAHAQGMEAAASASRNYNPDLPGVELPAPPRPDPRLPMMLERAKQELSVTKQNYDTRLAELQQMKSAYDELMVKLGFGRL